MSLEPHGGSAIVPLLLMRVEQLLNRLGDGATESVRTGLPANGNGASRRSSVLLPDPRLVRRILRQRRLRDRYFESELFADPAWDILLELAACRAEHRRISVSSLCIAAAVPPTTALRWISHMTEMGLLVRERDPDDKRRVYVVMADDVARALARFFDEIGRDAAKLT